MVTNLIGLGILLALFIILRKSAWKVLNRLVPKTDMDRWTHIFFSFTDVFEHVNEKRKGHVEDITVIDPTQATFEGVLEGDAMGQQESLPVEPGNDITKIQYFFFLPMNIFFQMDKDLYAGQNRLLVANLFQ